MIKIYQNLDINNLENEIWKIVTDFSDYQISSLGRVKSFKRYKNGKILKQDKIKNGYLQVSLSLNNIKRRRKIHRLILETFNPIINSDDLQCNHIDGNKENNILENLEWCTSSENIKHAFNIGLIKSNHKSKCVGENNSQSKLAGEDILYIKNILNKSKSCHICKELSDLFKVHPSTIYRIRRNKRWNHIK